MEPALRQVRGWKTSKISIQTQQYALLDAVESALVEDSQPLEPAAYLAGLLQVLHNRSVAAPATLLLSTVVPHVSPALLGAKLDVLIGRMAPVLVDGEADTSVIRASIQVLQHVLCIVEPAAWGIPVSELGPLRVVRGILAMVHDSRPKVRRRALEAISAILDSTDRKEPALLAADTAIDMLESASERPQLMHALQLCQVVAPSWPSLRVPSLCEGLLDVCRSSEQFVVTLAFSVLQTVVQSGCDPALLAGALTKLAPNPQDKQLAPAWLAALAQIWTIWDKAWENLPGLIQELSAYLAGPPDVAESASQVLVAIFSESPPTTNIKEVGTLLFGLLHIKYREAWGPVCSACAAYFDACGPKACADDIVKVMGVLRDDAPSAPADAVMAAAIRNLGPSKVLDLVPLDLDPTTGGGRAWLLPLLRENVQHAYLKQFSTQLLPLSESFANRAQKMKNPRHAKVLMTVSDQLFSLWPRYCDLPADLPEALTRDLVETVLARMYTKPEVRPVISQGFRLLVESNVAYSEGDIEIPDFPPRKASESVKFLAKNFGVSILRALLNVFTQAPVDSRGYLLDSINVYLAIIDSSAVVELFDQVSKTLADHMTDELGPTMLDIIVAIVPYLPSESHLVFLNIFKAVVPHKEPLLQKKAYRAFTRLATTEEGRNTIVRNISDIQEFLLEQQNTVVPAAKRTRIQTLAYVIELSDLWFVFNVLPEVILATRDVNERTREAAFNLLISMGRRFSEDGAVIDHSKIEELDDDDVVPASLETFFEMAMAGLASTNQHMIAATITALSSILHEFGPELSSEVVGEYVETVWLFLESQSREIVGAVLGFVKVSVLLLPTSELEKRLPHLLSRLLEWSAEHKQHFKSRVRHIVERLLRKCGYEVLAAAFPPEHQKLLQNIHKSKERARRKGKTPGETGDSNGPRERKFDNEFDEALYGSESESEFESEPEQTKKKAPKSRDQVIVGSEEPLDLLDERALTHITSQQSHNHRKALKGNMKERDGKLVLKDDVEDEAPKDALSAYAEAVRQKPLRTQQGKLKFKRGKRAQPESDDEQPMTKAPPARKKAKLPKRRALR